MMAKILLIQHELECVYPLRRALECPFQCLPSAWLSVLCEEGLTVTEEKQACIHPPASASKPLLGPKDPSLPLVHLPRESISC